MPKQSVSLHRQVRKAELIAKTLHQPDQMLSQAMQVPVHNSAQQSHLFIPCAPAVVHTNIQQPTFLVKSIRCRVNASNQPPLSPIHPALINHPRPKAAAALTLHFPLPSYNLYRAIRSRFSISTVHSPLPIHRCRPYVHSFPTPP